MNYTSRAFKFLGVALVALALMTLPALAVSPSSSSSQQFALSSHQTGIPFREPGTFHLLSLALAVGLIGTVTVTYKFPISGTVAPTAAQASQVPTITAVVNWLESDTTFLFTHNLNIATAPGFAGIQPSLASLFPEVIIAPMLNSGTVYPNVQVDYSTSTGNVLVFFKGSIAGTGGTLAVTVRRPHSIGL